MSSAKTVEILSLMPLFDASGEGACELDDRGKIILANNSLSRISGYDLGELTGKSCNELFEREKSAELQNLSGAVASSGGILHFEGWNLLRKDGRRIPVSGSFMQVAGAESGGAYLARFSDLSEKMMLSDELARTKKLEAVGVMAGGFAHDYNNALTAIMGNLSLAKMDVEDNVELLDVLNDAEQGAFKVMELTKRLAIFAKAGSPVKKPCNAGDIIKDAVEYSRMKLHCAIETEIASDLISIEVDELQIKNVIQNIIVNASEAMPKGGKIRVTAGNITIEEPKSHHEISLQRNRYVLVSIKDEGTGISPDDIDKIYDPYFSTRDSQNGLGLAVCYAVVKRHHGYIEAESTPGKGSEFRIYLPLAE